MTQATTDIAVLVSLKQPCFLRALADCQDLIGFHEAADGQTEEKEERHLRCRTCGKSITSSRFGMAVNGRHQHTFPNPLGIVFEIGCFSMASGCTQRGNPTGNFSWFPGFAWCFALCAGCLSHLGWHYSSAESTFYGLIMANLVSRS
jgi:hypothetical protein